MGYLFCCSLQVHTVMYGYYFLSMNKAWFSESFQTMLYKRIGRNVTRFQMTQFVTMIAQGAYSMMYSPYPAFFSKLLFFYIISLLAMFLSFYLSKFGGKKAGAGVSAEKKRK